MLFNKVSMKSLSSVFGPSVLVIISWTFHDRTGRSLKTVKWLPGSVCCMRALLDMVCFFMCVTR